MRQQRKSSAVLQAGTGIAALELVIPLLGCSGLASIIQLASILHHGTSSTFWQCDTLFCLVDRLLHLKAIPIGINWGNLRAWPWRPGREPDGLPRNRYLAVATRTTAI